MPKRVISVMPFAQYEELLSRKKLSFHWKLKILRLYVDSLLTGIFTTEDLRGKREFIDMVFGETQKEEEEEEKRV